MLRRVVLGLIAILLAAEPAQALKKYGVSDLSGKIIVPCEYREVRCLSPQWFFLGTFDPKNPAKNTYDGKLVDYNGASVPGLVPQGWELSDVYLPEPHSKTWKTTSLPKGTLLKVHGPSGFGLIKPDGEVVLKPNHEFIMPYDGKFAIYEGKWLNHLKPVSVFDAKNRDWRFEVSDLTEVRSKERHHPYGSKTSPTFSFMERLFDNVFVMKRADEQLFHVARQDGTILFDLPTGTTSVTIPQNYEDRLLVCHLNENRSAKAYADGTLCKHIYVDFNGKPILEVTSLSAGCFAGSVAKLAISEIININGKVIGDAKSGIKDSAWIPFVEQPNRLLRCETEKDTFNRYQWRDPSPGASPYHNRFDQLKLFVDEFNLIGMHRSQVTYLLGTLVISNGSCGNSSSWMEIEYKDDLVDRWRIVRNDTVSPWITSRINSTELIKVWDTRSPRPWRFTKLQQKN